MLQRLFTEHPASVGESYGEHARMGLGFSSHLALAAGACIVHAILPFLFVKTGSSKIADLHQQMLASRVQAKTRQRSAAAAEHAPL